MGIWHEQDDHLAEGSSDTDSDFFYCAIPAWLKTRHCQQIVSIARLSDSSKPLEQAFTNEDIVHSDFDKCSAFYGMTIISLATGRLATIGSFILSKNIYYSLTGAPAFADACKADTTTALSEVGGNDTERPMLLHKSE